MQADNEEDKLRQSDFVGTKKMHQPKVGVWTMRHGCAAKFQKINLLLTQMQTVRHDSLGEK